MDTGNALNEMPCGEIGKGIIWAQHSGVYWQEYCHKQCEAAGFFNVSTNWPGVYFNDTTKMLLVVYVDDMKCSGPKDKMKETWQALSQNLNLEEPKGDIAGTHTFLGCIHKRSSKTVNGVKLETMEYDVKASVKKAVDKYKEAVYEITGKEPLIWKADTPFLHDELKAVYCANLANRDRSWSAQVVCTRFRWRIYQVSLILREKSEKFKTLWKW